MLQAMIDLSVLPDDAALIAWLLDPLHGTVARAGHRSGRAQVASRSTAPAPPRADRAKRAVRAVAGLTDVAPAPVHGGPVHARSLRDRVDREAVEQRRRPDRHTLGPELVAAYALDLASGRIVYGLNRTRSLAPASNQKLWANEGIHNGFLTVPVPRYCRAQSRQVVRASRA